MELLHSFPRQAALDDDEEIAVGAGLFKSFLEIGPLLTYEKISFPLFGKNGVRDLAATSIEQLRFCLTALGPREIYDHSAVFGAFSFAFDQQLIRLCGGFPVIYVPGPISSGIEIQTQSTVGSNFIHQLRDVVVLLQELIHLQDLIEINREDLTEQILIEADRLSGHVSLAQIEIVLDFLLGSKVSFAFMLEALQFSSNFFYHADSSRVHKLLDVYDLAYYTQREWRLVAGLLSDVGTTDEALSPTEARSLAQIHPFFLRILEKCDGSLVRHCDMARKLPIMAGRPFARCVERAYIPDECISELKPIAVAAGIPPDAVTPVSYAGVRKRRRELRDAKGKGSGS